MSKIAILRPRSCFAREFTAALIFLLNPWASELILAMHLLLPCPKSVIVAGTQPIGGSDVTPIFLAPNPYKSCRRST